MSPAPRFKRILLKLSGEVLMGEGGGLSIDPTVTARVAEEIADVKAQGYELCIVVGGGHAGTEAALAAARMGCPARLCGPWAAGELRGKRDAGVQTQRFLGGCRGVH